MVSSLIFRDVVYFYKLSFLTFFFFKLNFLLPGGQFVFFSIYLM